MIEREFVKDKIKSFNIRECVYRKISKVAGVGAVDIEKTPLGEKIIIHACKPGLVIGSGGETVKDLTQELRKKFELENPQIEIREINQKCSQATVVAKKIASDFDRFGARKFKVIGYRALKSIIGEGALGAEIRIAGRGVPSERAHVWRFFSGHLKKSGDPASTLIDKAYDVANLRSGSVGIQVMIMPKDARLPDVVNINPKPAVQKAEEAPQAVAPIDLQTSVFDVRSEDGGRQPEQIKVEGAQPTDAEVVPKIEELKAEPVVEVKEEKIAEAPKAKAKPKADKPKKAAKQITLTDSTNVKDEVVKVPAAEKPEKKAKAAEGSD